MQAVGNDFVIVEESSFPAETDWATVAIRLCDRHFGVGGDGLLVVCPSAVADVRMRMFNPDGTEDMCGNGLRCVVKWAHERGLLTGKQIPGEQKGAVETMVGVRSVSVEMSRSGSEEIATEMGMPLFTADALPMLLPDRNTVFDFPLRLDRYGEFAISVVNTGSTHTVIWVDELPDDETFFAVSPKIEHHPIFPKRTSVLWVKSDTQGKLDIGEVFAVRIWERGAGETLGCGTGACAVMVLAAEQGRAVQREVWGDSYVSRVVSRGGDLYVTYRPADARIDPNTVWLSGTAHTVYSGTILLTAIARHGR